MAVSRANGSVPVALGGAGRTLDIRDAWEFGYSLDATNVDPLTGAVVRYGAGQSPIVSTTWFKTGSAGNAPDRGFRHLNGVMCAAARSTAATTTPWDRYSELCLRFPIVRPTLPLPDPMAVYEVEITMGIENPAVPITQDCGLFFIMSAVTGFPAIMRGGNLAGNDYAGFGCYFNGQNGELRYGCKTGSAHPAALAEEVTLGVFGVGVLIPVKFRFQAATPNSDAQFAIFINGIQVLSRDWGAGTLLPTPATVVNATVLGYLRPVIRAAQESAANAHLYWRNFRIGAAPSVDLLG
jgi:hypothetical protein